MAHIKKALKKYGYPNWTIKKVKKDMAKKAELTTMQKKQHKKKQQQDRAKGMVVLPYIKGTTEAVRRVLKKYGVGTCVKPYQTLRQILVHPKDKIEHTKKTEVVYQIPCKNCSHSYVGETARKLETRVKEHRQEYEKATDSKYTRSTRKVSETELSKSAITDHAKQCNHVIDWEGAKVIDSESDKY